MRMGPTSLAGCLTRRELVDRYADVTGRTIDNPLFYYVFGLFKVIVIVQQIYARFVRRHTSDLRFAQLNEMVAVLSHQAERAIDSGNI
jgi:aminoglycoside phosphotransferase (APT) family kinase protein